jgi:hypothetical protein
VPRENPELDFFAISGQENPELDFSAISGQENPELEFFAISGKKNPKWENFAIFGAGCLYNLNTISIGKLFPRHASWHDHQCIRGAGHEQRSADVSLWTA